jgi:ribosome biogenesis GTPase
MTGKIVKGISGFYYVHIAGSGIYECKAKGIFRHRRIKPLVGDDVKMTVISEEDMTGNIDDILPRRNELIRPAVANIDQALVIFAAAKPTPNLNLLDRFLITMEYQGVPVAICFNKRDLATDEQVKELVRVYSSCGYRVMGISATEDDDLGELAGYLTGKTTAVAGPSGVGKSTIINRIAPDAGTKTGEISEKIERGKHTTRHTEIFPVTDGTYIMDTPGFSTLDIPGLEAPDLARFYPEFLKYEPQCRFNACSHINEPSCGVKEALSEGLISEIRYENYKQLYDELKNRKKY